MELEHSTEKCERFNVIYYSCMRNAYALLGLAFVIVLGGAFLLFDRAEAPTRSDELSDNVDDMALTLTSPAFSHNGNIPPQYTCDGENVLPPLAISGVPAGTGSLVLVMDDPDIPQVFKESRGIDAFDHLVVYNIPTDAAVIDAGTMLGLFGENSAGNAAYTGPCPPSEYEPTEHRYVFRLYAIDGTLEFDTPPTLDEVETAAKARTIESAELIGRYERQ